MNQPQQTEVTPSSSETAEMSTVAGGFAPAVDTHPVAAFTLGRQVFNDSDKDNYFEG
ncbi:hypothetical protein RM717_32580 [Streptomyces griseus]|uniref:Uncharacterized protein n=1 Tax=Streptomyces stephensoniae TaxID=3375367 RepID=A0ABU2WD52_9ACTN|nr:hypothetical protein [Streptomyces griseus]MDT0495234.1 hypothetical protein [Streptomyces griseus]